MANRSYQRACAPVLLISAADAMIARAECGCGAALDWRLASRKPPPDIIRKHFIQRGWRLDRRATCPTCQEKKPMAIAAKPPIATSEAQASEAARTAKQLVFLALIDYYDQPRKAYKPGHSDETIAKECGVARDFVARLREADFGPLVQPDEVRTLRDELAAAQANVAGIASRFDKLCQRNGWVA